MFNSIHCSFFLKRLTHNAAGLLMAVRGFCTILRMANYSAAASRELDKKSDKITYFHCRLRLSVQALEHPLFLLEHLKVPYYAKYQILPIFSNHMCL